VLENVVISCAVHCTLNKHHRPIIKFSVSW